MSTREPIDRDFKLILEALFGPRGYIASARIPTKPGDPSGMSVTFILEIYIIGPVFTFFRCPPGVGHLS
jgi:hypothetical protein